MRLLTGTLEPLRACQRAMAHGGVRGAVQNLHVPRLLEVTEDNRTPPGSKHCIVE